MGAWAIPWSFRGEVLPGLQALPGGEGTANIMRLLIADDALGLKKANRPRLKVPSDFRDLS